MVPEHVLDSPSQPRTGRYSKTVHRGEKYFYLIASALKCHVKDLTIFIERVTNLFLKLVCKIRYVLPYFSDQLIENVE